MINKYDRLQKHLHKLFLGNHTVLDFCFDIQEFLFGYERVSVFKNVFISGLARSGTTALLNNLNTIEGFSSLKYFNLPFIFLPKFSCFINSRNKKNLELVERAHSDKIYINLNSPEAFDEIFWKFQLKNSYIDTNCLNINLLKKNDFDDFKIFIGHQLLKNQNQANIIPTYLSKNNNNILRIKSILEYLPKSLNVFMFRDPLQHAFSLKNQHFKFVKKQNEEIFVLDYFNLLGHHEFGNGHKYFNLGNENLNNKIEKSSIASIDYWLLIWLNYYTYLASLESENIMLINYTHFCDNPTIYVESICNKIGHKSKDLRFNPFVTDSYIIDEKYDKEVLDQCYEIYKTMNLKTIKAR